MKSCLLRKGQTGLVLAFSLVLASCNQQEEYFPIEELIAGADAYCSQALDAQSCQQLGNICQPAYLDVEIDTEEPVFTACVANPDAWENQDSTDSSSGGSEGGSDGSSNGGPSSGSTADESVPTLDEAFKAKCENLDAKYLWVKQELQKGILIKETRKVKICHMTGNDSSHTLLVACPALKGHSKHGDYLGACNF